MTASLFDKKPKGRFPSQRIGRLAQISLVLLLGFCFGCAARHAIGVNYLVPRDCRAEVRLIDCDRNSPPNCKRMAATYPKGCEQLAAKID